MPDESCRLCGGALRTHSQCSECKKAIQRTCLKCNTLTWMQFHEHCKQFDSVPNLQNGYVLGTIQRQGEYKRSHHVRSISICLGIVGFFILGLSTAAYLEVFPNISPNILPVELDTNPITHMGSFSSANNIFQNCLAYGSGESVTVTCPTQYGYVYKAILETPKDLAIRFSDSVFSIRGVSVIENSDATVILQYQNNNYLTSFFAS